MSSDFSELVNKQPECIIDGGYALRQLPPSKNQPHLYRCKTENCQLVKELKADSFLPLQQNRKYPNRPQHHNHPPALGYLFSFTEHKKLKPIMHVPLPDGHVMRIERPEKMDESRLICIVPDCEAVCTKVNGKYNYKKNHSPIHDKIIMWVNEATDADGKSIKEQFCPGIDDPQLLQLRDQNIVVLDAALPPSINTDNPGSLQRAGERENLESDQAEGDQRGETREEANSEIETSPPGQENYQNTNLANKVTNPKQELIQSGSCAEENLAFTDSEKEIEKIGNLKISSVKLTLKKTAAAKKDIPVSEECADMAFGSLRFNFARAMSLDRQEENVGQGLGNNSFASNQLESGHQSQHSKETELREGRLACVHPKDVTDHQFPTQDTVENQASGTVNQDSMPSQSVDEHEIPNEIQALHIEEGECIT